MTMVERVTAAVKADLGKQLGAQPLHGGGPNADWFADGGSIDLERLVRVGIEAMREPTEEMIKLGDNETNCGGSCRNASGKLTWRAMIDAALKP